VGKVKQLFVCSECGRPSAQWSGKCAACGGWGTVTEHPAAGAGVAGSSGGSAQRVLDLLPDPEERRIPTGFPHVDRVLGGGLVRGSVVLLAGAPGIGKSTLLLQLASSLTGAGYPCLLSSGEEARNQVALRAHRLGIDGARVAFTSGRVLADVIATALAENPAVLIVDSIHTLRDDGSESLPGGTAQVRACADAMVALAKERGITVILIGHVTKGGDVAGPRTLEHAVDVVLTFEGEPRSGLRVLAGGKNRFGPEGEVAWFSMTGQGLAEQETGPRLGDAEAEPGCATALALAGRRAFAVDVQTLVAATEGPPRRQVAGLDPRRFQIVAAVTERVAVPRLGRAEVFGACSGGLRLEDPGVDLAIAAALVSAETGLAPRPGCAFVGELSLTGVVRPVAGMDQRLSAALAAGVPLVVVPAGPSEAGPEVRAVRTVPVRHLRDALRVGLEGVRSTARSAS
jgi:DNA repair protein RadA/Sms